LWPASLPSCSSLCMRQDLSAWKMVLPYHRISIS
jgi:hypothetical protein